MVRPERFELPAFWFVARRSIQLSYGRTGDSERNLRQINRDPSGVQLRESGCRSGLGEGLRWNERQLLFDVEPGLTHEFGDGGCIEPGGVVLHANGVSGAIEDGGGECHRLRGCRPARRLQLSVGGVL